LVWSVATVDARAARAVVARVARFDLGNRYASQLCLSGDEPAQPPERPVVQPPSLVTVGLRPVADIGQIFQPNGAAGALRALDEGLRDDVVVAGLRPSFSSRACAAIAWQKWWRGASNPRTGARDGRGLSQSHCRCRIAIANGCSVNDAEVEAEAIDLISFIRIQN
jgi:hypothetical protein